MSGIERNPLEGQPERFDKESALKTRESRALTYLPQDLENIEPTFVREALVVQNEHQHSHFGDISENPKYSIENPPKKLWLVSRAGYFLAGLIPAGISVAGWAFDAAITAMGIPHGIFLHGPLTFITVMGSIPLDIAWRGYSSSGKGVLSTAFQAVRNVRSKEHRHTHGESHYDGSGYPISGTTFAQENLNGRYEQNPITRGMSRVALFFAPFAHIGQSILDNAAEISEKVWSRPKTFRGISAPLEWLSHGVEVAATMVFGGGIYKGIEDGWSYYKRDKSLGTLMLKREK